jgi:hypothetical protein
MAAKVGEKRQESRALESRVRNQEPAFVKMTKECVIEKDSRSQEPRIKKSRTIVKQFTLIVLGFYLRASLLS